jgi:hypothetical protein
MGQGRRRPVAVSPTGSTVFVTGYDGTFAYNAATGAERWAAYYLDESGYPTDFASVAVSPSGATVYVTGNVNNPDHYYATVAYNAATGAQLWANVPTNAYGWATSVAVSPSGDKVFVTGYGFGGGWGEDYVTIAYSG